MHKRRKRSADAKNICFDTDPAILNALHHPIMVVDSAYKIIYCNEALCTFCRLPREKLISQPCHDIFHHTSFPPEICPLERVLRNNETERFLLQIPDQTTWLDITMSPYVSNGGPPNSAIHTITDVTSLVKREQEMRQLLEEKNLLLKEIHHRVKNNLQIVSSLLNLQQNRVRSNKYKQVLIDSQNRIKAMMLIHETLYTSGMVTHVDPKRYLKKLVKHIFNTYAITPEQIVSEIRIDSLPIHIDTAIPCGLIVNELVSNSIKHAFPNMDGSKKPLIKIHFQIKENELKLSVSDNGIRISEKIDIQRADTFGLEIVNALVQQLNGEISLNTRTGTTFVISCKFKPLR